MMKDFPLNKVFTLIESGPVLLVATADGRKKNIMAVSWSMPMDFSPDIALVTGSWNHSFGTLMKTRECVLAVPAVDLMKKTVGIGMCSGTDTDKFRKFELTAGKAQKVRAPLILECLANIECHVTDYIEKHGIVVLSAVKAWIDEDRKERRGFHAVGDGRFIVDGRTVNLRKMMEAKIPSGV